MTGNITVAKSWNELNQWQAQEIAHLYLNTAVDDFADAYLKRLISITKNIGKIAHQQNAGFENSECKIKFLYICRKFSPLLYEDFS